MSRSLWSSSPANGKLYEYCSGESLGKTLDYYQTYVNEEIAVMSIDKPKDHPTECNALWTGADLLKTISNLNIDLLTTEELALLERQQATLLGQTRQRKTGLSMEAVATLREKVEEEEAILALYLNLCETSGKEAERREDLSGKSALMGYQENDRANKELELVLPSEPRANDNYVLRLKK